MDNAKQQIVDRIKQANNILVTVSANPSVDQLAGAIGLTLLLNRMGKHGTAVFSGQVPSTIEFLQPEKTLEKNTDSLRDFIIALDKAKADKLRYKVEDSHVKIFITPYRTSLTEADLEFSQGDFNVEMVLALGVADPKDLDQAITSHGRILHDATVATLDTKAGNNLGTLNWIDPNASSLCEMLAALGDALGPDLLDDQMATAFLTGVVAETERFSNSKTSAVTMSISARLMAAGANQQLVATKLQEALPKPETPPATTSSNQATDGQPTEVMTTAAPADKAAEDGALAIDHGENKPGDDEQSEESIGGELQPDQEAELDQIRIDEKGTLLRGQTAPDKQPPAGPGPDANKTDGSKLVLDPPSLGGALTANTLPEGSSGSSDAMSQAEGDKPLLSHEDAKPDEAQPANSEATADTAPIELPPVSPAANLNLPNPFARDEDNPPAAAAPASTAPPLEAAPATETPAAEPPAAELGAARDAVNDAIGAAPTPLEPIAALNAQPVDLDLDKTPLSVPEPATPTAAPTAPSEPATQPEPSVISPNASLPPVPEAEAVAADPAEPPAVAVKRTLLPIEPTPSSATTNPDAPPPVPPPMMPPPASQPDEGENTPPAGSTAL